MSQDEVLRCLVNLGGSANLDALATEYRRIHFPADWKHTRNSTSKFSSLTIAKKTMQADTAKLIRDGLIIRTYIKRENRQPFERRYGFYQITPRGYKYIEEHKLTDCLKIIK